jgi:hypothetical protein
MKELLVGLFKVESIKLSPFLVDFSGDLKKDIFDPLKAYLPNTFDIPNHDSSTSASDDLDEMQEPDAYDDLDLATRQNALHEKIVKDLLKTMASGTSGDDSESGAHDDESCDESSDEEDPREAETLLPFATKSQSNSEIWSAVKNVLDLGVEFKGHAVDACSVAPGRVLSAMSHLGLKRREQGSAETTTKYK